MMVLVSVVLVSIDSAARTQTARQGVDFPPGLVGVEPGLGQTVTAAELTAAADTVIRQPGKPRSERTIGRPTLNGGDEGALAAVTPDVTAPPCRRVSSA